MKQKNSFLLSMMYAMSAFKDMERGMSDNSNKSVMRKFVERKSRKGNKGKRRKRGF